MSEKENFYQSILHDRELAADPAVTACTCPDTLCDWHGKCKECVALHRRGGGHVPVCLQPMLRDKIVALVGAVEMTAAQGAEVPEAYRRYVIARDKGAKAE